MSKFTKKEKTSWILYSTIHDDCEYLIMRVKADEIIDHIIITKDRIASFIKGFLQSVNDNCTLNGIEYISCIGVYKETDMETIMKALDENEVYLNDLDKE